MSIIDWTLIAIGVAAVVGMFAEISNRMGYDAGIAMGCIVVVAIVLMSLAMMANAQDDWPRFDWQQAERHRESVRLQRQILDELQIMNSRPYWSQSLYPPLIIREPRPYQPSPLSYWFTPRPSVHYNTFPAPVPSAPTAPAIPYDEIRRRLEYSRVK